MLVVHKPPESRPPSEVINGGGIWASEHCGPVGVNARLSRSLCVVAPQRRRIVTSMKDEHVRSDM
jgi:hypothetical protein